MGDHRDARELLRAAAAEHRPDRARMLARVQAGMAEEAGPASAARPGPRWRVLAATAAVALGCVLAVTLPAVGWLGEGGGAGPAERGAPAAVLSSEGAIDPGSGPYWSQSNVTLETSQPLTALAVELRVVAEDGMRPTGGWRTLPTDDFTLSVVHEGGDLVFRWELRPGAEVPTGSHVFAGQYDHDAGPRAAALDRYLVTGEGPAGPVTASGGFS
ncbi:hypothetical protein RM844_02615 [Streptomyces sp. DSM 44915]|uniref:Anti-sigma factor n=1 Tax=Streptomyces chisholmiae TaxID=3075540 RepID=A0ABU2JJT1_9ACTN|nr:hypothetical protein [Streptomyces sp. DSM 44915]MDT0265177.1 hypothetical protein [Streptomyces sp. DSM 44915]